MSEIKQSERKFIFDELCRTCTKRVYIHCDYTHNRADEPQCVIGKTLKQAYLKGNEDADIFHSEQHEKQLQELTDKYEHEQRENLWVIGNYKQRAEEAEKQLQELRDRAVEAHRAICINTKCQSNTAYDKGFGNNQCSGNCAYVKQFAQKLTEKQ